MSDNLTENNERQPEAKSAERSEVRREVESELASSNQNRGREQFSESSRQSNELERNGVLPALQLDDNFEPTGITASQKPATPDCSKTDTTTSDGRKLPTLLVEQAGLPPSESKGSLTATPVDNIGRADQRTLVTTAHGMVSLEKYEGPSNYQLLDKGFQRTDKNGDGSLSREELQNRVQEGVHGFGDPNSPHASKSESLAYQAQYALDNYDRIASKSKEMNPSATGITNEGLAQHYLENAKVTVRTASGDSFKAEVASGNRNTDIAVLKTESLTQTQQEALGKNFQVAKTDPQEGDKIKAVGHPRGTWGAEAACYKPTQSAGTVGDAQPNKLISGQAILHDAATHSGMSGGPVVDSRREQVLVGLNHAGNGGTYNSLVPASAIREELQKAQRK